LAEGKVDSKDRKMVEQMAGTKAVWKVSTKERREVGWLVEH